MNIDDLVNHYTPKVDNAKQDMENLAQRYSQGRNDTFIEAMACSVAVMGIKLGEGFDSSVLTPEMTEAFHLAFPNVDIESVGNYSGEGLTGLLAAWKGKLFEVSVRDRLNEGEWVGNYHLEAGQTAELAEKANQAGWDLQILNDNGSILEQVQLKSTDYISYVEQSLERYPEYQILATSELAPHEGVVDGLVVSDIADGQLESELASAVTDNSLGLLDIGLPLIPMAFNVYWVATGKRTWKEGVVGTVISGAAIAGGNIVGGFVADTVNDLVGDAVLDGLGAVVLDGIFGFGIFTLLRMGFKALSAADEKQKAKARAAENQAKRDKEVIEGVFSHIDESGSTFDQTLRVLTKQYSHAPAASTAILFT